MTNRIIILFFIYFMSVTNSFAVGKAMINQAKEIAEKNNLNFINDKKEEDIDDKIRKNKDNRRVNNAVGVENKANNQIDGSAINKENNVSNQVNNGGKANNETNNGSIDGEDKANNRVNNGVINSENKDNNQDNNGVDGKNKNSNNNVSEKGEDDGDNDYEEYLMGLIIGEFEKINPLDNEETIERKLTEGLMNIARNEMSNPNNRDKMNKIMAELQKDIEDFLKDSNSDVDFDMEQFEKFKRLFESDMRIESFVPPYSTEYYKYFNSFMFSNKSINLIRKVLEIYSKNNSAKNGMFVGAESEEDKYDINVGNVYLQSIMYISNNYWSVWINDKKISNENNNDEDNEFFIKKLNRNTAEIRWRVSKAKWGIINYENSISKSDYNINEKTNKVEFDMVLHPNQSFIASRNEVIDGKYRPIIEENVDGGFTDEHLESIFNGEDIDLDLLTN